MNDDARPGPRTPLLLGVWLWVGAPFGYGVVDLARKVTQLIGG